MESFTGSHFLQELCSDYTLKIQSKALVLISKATFGFWPFLSTDVPSVSDPRQYRQVHLPDYYAPGYHSLRAASSPNYMQPGKCSPSGWQSLEEGQNHHPGVPDLEVAKIQARLCKVLHSSELEFLICRDVTYLKGLNMTIKQCYIHNPQGLLPSRCSTNIC